jgi:hypothetical protein
VERYNIPKRKMRKAQNGNIMMILEVPSIETRALVIRTGRK